MTQIRRMNTIIADTTSTDFTESHDSVCDDASIIIAATRPQSGDIVTLENLVFIPQNDFIPESLFDLTSTTKSNTTSTTAAAATSTIVLDGGHFIPGLHEIIRTQCSLNTSISNVVIDAGYGHYRSDLVFHVPISKIQQSQQSLSPLLLKVGTSIRLQPGDIPVLIKDILDNGNIAVLDANSPLAGSSYLCSFKLTAIHRIENPTFVSQKPNNKTTTTSTNSNDGDVTANIVQNDCIAHKNDRFQVATFALGCFWGAELAYMRTNGVVGTRVGYTNGVVATHHPTYNDVCNDGLTQQCEAVQIIYDTSMVSYSTLIDIAMDRIRTTNRSSGYDLHKLFQSESNDNESKQYRHGIYFHTKEQDDIIQALLGPTDTENKSPTNTWFQRYQIETCRATTFWEAEEYHQQYLYKGGQSARKGAKEPIRCYG